MPILYVYTYTFSMNIMITQNEVFGYRTFHIVNDGNRNFTKYALFVLLFTALKKLMPSSDDLLAPQLIISISFPMQYKTWIPTRLLRNFLFEELSSADVLEDIVKSDISTTRPSVVTRTSTSEPQSIVEVLQFRAVKILYQQQLY